MAKIERTYNIPLRKGFFKAPKYKKTKKAIFTLREFLIRNMKCTPEQLRIGKQLNEKVWAQGYKHPPHHVKVTVIKEDDGVVKAELFGFKYEEPIKPAEKETKESKVSSKAGEKAVKEAEADVKDLEKELKEVVKEEKAEKKEKKEKKTETTEKADKTTEEKEVKKRAPKKKVAPKEEKE
jgi:large subunit ribosomal protein L31e